MKNVFFAVGLLTILWSCGTKEKKTQQFTLLSSEDTGVAFNNSLEFVQEFNVYTYRNFYNGGGVGLGDINNDGLVDIYFVANQGSNKLYLNKGNFTFEDITEKAGVAGNRAWSTGVSISDINGDGLLDIYVCNSGDKEGDDKRNELFINNGDLTFSEKAEEYNVADAGYSTHAAFFDYDKDGDLDLYLLNNSYQAIGSFNLRKNARPERDSLGGDKLMRNVDGRFVNVSEESGIYGSIIGFGLGVTVGDINKDGWLDIYVSNDFFERDYIYLNNGDGTFREVLEQQMMSISAASMGADLADINNDGYGDIFVTEMLPNENDRLKTITTFESWDRYQNAVENDYYHQFTRNMLHLNNGDNTFSEIGRLVGVEATDWSWGALIFDMNNDGWKDIFVANGIYQDLTNQDFLRYISNDEVIMSIVSKDNVNYKKLVEVIPSVKISNFAFVNKGRLNFENQAQELGLGTPSFSNGSAYGDLDNGGDLDLVVNNVNMECFIYRNEADALLKDNHYLKFNLVGKDKNPFALGTKITVKHNNQLIYAEQMPVRGFQSTMDHRPNIGLGEIEEVDSVIINWPDDKVTYLTNVKADQTLTVNQKDGQSAPNVQVSSKGISSRKIFKEVDAGAIPFTHKENDFVDFDRDRLLYHMRSTEGPKIASGDVNGDGKKDIYMGGAKGSPGALMLQTQSGNFITSNEELLANDKISEDTDALFFDADNDGDLDLYVTSGGNEFSSSSTALKDRLYINDGSGKFSKSPQVLPESKYQSTSCVVSADYDGDGDMDLFVGSRLMPFIYGVPVNGYLLENDGTGTFKNVSKEKAPAMEKMGMITGAVWSDIDADGDEDLLVVGEWMSVKIFENNEGKFKLKELENSKGWWNSIKASDLDGDGDIDFVIGNHGLNSQFKASTEKPVKLYVNDFDNNGKVEHILCTYFGDKTYPMVLRHDLVAQIPMLRKEYPKYEDYKDQQLTDIFSEEQIEVAIKHEVNELATSVLWNNGDGNFEMERLPIEAQFSPVYGILIEDFDRDGAKDILLGGNLYNVKPDVGKYDASYGTLLKGGGQRSFKAVNATESGIKIRGEVRDFEIIQTNNGNYLLVARNNDTPKIYRWNNVSQMTTMAERSINKIND